MEPKPLNMLVPDELNEQLVEILDGDWIVGDDFEKESQVELWVESDGLTFFYSVQRRIWDKRGEWFAYLSHSDENTPHEYLHIESAICPTAGLALENLVGFLKKLGIDHTDSERHDHIEGRLCCPICKEKQP